MKVKLNTPAEVISPDGIARTIWIIVGMQMFILQNTHHRPEDLQVAGAWVQPIP